MSEVLCLAEAEDPDNSWSTGAWLWSSSILFLLVLTYRDTSSHFRIMRTRVIKKNMRRSTEISLNVSNACNYDRQCLPRHPVHMIYRMLMKYCAQKQQLNPTVLLSKIWYWISFLDPYIFFLCFFGIKKHSWNTHIIPRLNPSTSQRIGTFEAKEDNSFLWQSKPQYWRPSQKLVYGPEVSSVRVSIQWSFWASHYLHSLKFIQPSVYPYQLTLFCCQESHLDQRQHEDIHLLFLLVHEFWKYFRINWSQ